MNTFKSMPIIIKQPDYSGTLIIGSSLMENLHLLTQVNAGFSGYVIFTDKTVRRLYCEKLKNSLDKLKKRIEIIEVTEGEKSKSMSNLEKILAKIIKLGINRNFCLLAVGGGVVSDIGGFVASITFRGISYINIPTTLLAQVDASIGGKTGVDLWTQQDMYKNMIGSFYQPVAVISDVGTLSTLPDREIKNGLGEILKYWVGWGKPNINKILNIKNKKDLNNMINVISECQKIKTEVVQKDPYERTGLRQKLNLGHTIGHAVEAVSNGKLGHGEAVAIGLVASAKISERMKFLDISVCEKIISQIKSLGLPISAPDMDINKIIEAVKYDKKGGNFVLIKDIGKLITGIQVDAKLLKTILPEITT